MALLKQCPDCGKRCSEKAKGCGKCGKSFAKLAGINWWIAYYDLNKKLVRKKVGPSKAAAEQEHRKHLTAKAELRTIEKSVDAVTKFKDLGKWYLELPEVKKKRSYKRDCVAMKPIVAYFGDKLLAQINTGMVEAFRQKRLGEISGKTKNALIQPSSVNRECACLRNIFNRAIRSGKAEKNPVHGLKGFKENARNRVLSQEEFVRLIDACHDHLKPIVKVGYFTGMRKGEILGLRWGQIDLKQGFIQLRPEDTKTQESRSIPLCQELMEMFRSMPRGLHGVPVFTYAGRKVGLIRKAFESACKKAEIEDFVFHDLRHTFNTNAYKSGMPIPTIMAITGHKSMSMFQRYLTLQPEDLREAMAKMEQRQM